ncbi:MAG: hypothetical protein AAF497_05705 [Planctomycetota bacterium]
MKQLFHWGHSAFVAVVLIMSVFLAPARAQNPEGKQKDVAAPPAVLEGLNAKQTDLLLKFIVPAYFAGNSEVLASSIPNLLASATDEQLDVIDKWSEENNVPTLEKLLAESRYWLAINNQSQRLPKVGPAETVSMLRYFLEKLDEVAERNAEFPAIDEEVPKLDGILKFRDYLWDMHVFDNELANHSLVALYAAKLAKSVSRSARKRLPPEDQEIVKVNFMKIARDMQFNRTALHEAELEMRCRRLMYAVKALEEEDDPKERMMAAFAVSVDSKMLLGFFGKLEMRQDKLEKHKSKRERKNVEDVEQHVFQRKLLNSRNLYQNIKKEAEKGHEIAGDLIEKSVLLFEGLRWWERGRYGTGPEAFGLLKNKLALKSREAMTAISMPIVAATPTDPSVEYDSAGGNIPEYLRRHLYIWSLEDRRFLADTRTDSLRTKEEVAGSERGTGKQTFF